MRCLWWRGNQEPIAKLTGEEATKRSSNHNNKSLSCSTFETVRETETEVQQLANVWEQGQSIQHHEFWRIHQPWPSQRRSWLGTSSHLIRGAGHFHSTLMPSAWLQPALLAFLSIHNDELPSSNPNLFTPMTPSPQHTIGPVQPFCPRPHFIMQWGTSGEDRDAYRTSRSRLHDKVQPIQCSHMDGPTSAWPSISELYNSLATLHSSIFN